MIWLYYIALMYGCTEVKFSHAEALSFAFPLSKKVFKHRGISGRHRPTKEQTTHFEARWGGSQSWSHWIELPRCAQRAFGLFNMESFCFFFKFCFFVSFGFWEVFQEHPNGSCFLFWYLFLLNNFREFPSYLDHFFQTWPLRSWGCILEILEILV